MAAARLTLAAAALALATAAASDETAPHLFWQPLDPNGREGEVRVEGLAPEPLALLGLGELPTAIGERILRVVAVAEAGGDGAELPNLWGTYRISGKALAFRPRHALGTGITLLARFDGEAFDDATGARGTASRELRYAPAPLDAPATAVVGVAPSGDEVPENLLRLYVEFSAPMSLGDVARQVGLLDERGEEIEGAFVGVPGGLWDPGRRRLTLLLDPGRVKRGLAAHESLGPPLRAGRSVTLVVRRGARDAAGRGLEREFVRTWRVGPAHRTALDLSAWTVDPPAAPEAELRVAFDRPLDRALVARALGVVGSRGEAFRGRWEIAPGERSASFLPEHPWREGALYRIVVDPVLEDACGNRLGSAFERDAADDPKRPPAAWLELTPPFAGPAR